MGIRARLKREDFKLDRGAPTGGLNAVQPTSTNPFKQCNVYELN